MTIQMLLNHMWMPTMLRRVVRRAAKNLSQKRSHMPGMICSHVREDGLEQFVFVYMLVEARCQSI
jgi:hypothetical protein